MYVCTRGNGRIVFDICAGTETTIPGTDGLAVRDFAPGPGNGSCITTSRTTAFTIRTGDGILLNSKIFDLYSYGTTLFMAEDSGAPWPAIWTARASWWI